MRAYAACALLQLGNTPETDILGKTYTNLLRRWVDD